MVNRKQFYIQFTGLKRGVHQYDYHIDRSFFSIFDYEEFENIETDVKAVLNKQQDTVMELNISHNGWVEVPCDLSGEMFQLPIEGSVKVIIRFGEEYDDTNEELLILPHGEYQFNIAQYIYEMIVLSVPQRRVSPEFQDQEDDFLDELDFLDLEEEIDWEEETPEEEEKENNKDTDPRWDKLKQLLTDK